MTVTILLSTYNGEKYLEQLIKSLLSQSKIDYQIVVRDDGSTDGTQKILEKYQNKNRLKWYQGKNIGPAESFMELLYSAPESDYYALCDQDDIWETEKLCTAIDALKKYDIEKPMVYTSNQKLIINHNISKNLRFIKTPHITLSGVLCKNDLSGCTMVINKSLYKKITVISSRPSKQMLRLRMHDTWINLAAILLGKLIYDAESYICYRIHENNTVGIESKNMVTFLKKLVQKFKEPSKRKGRSVAASELLLCFKDEMSEEDRTFLTEYILASKKRLKAITFFWNKRIRAEKEENSWLLLILGLLGWM